MRAANERLELVETGRIITIDNLGDEFLETVTALMPILFIAACFTVLQLRFTPALQMIEDVRSVNS